MNSNIVFQKFCQDRNIKSSTRNGYCSALKLYESFNNESIENLFVEARKEENERIPLKDRKIKKRLLNFRSYLLNSNLSPNTSKTYFSKVKTFYLHFEFELPHLQQAKYDKNYETNYLKNVVKSKFSSLLTSKSCSKPKFTSKKSKNN